MDPDNIKILDSFRITPNWRRAARQLLRWIQDDLTEHSSVPAPNLRAFEIGWESKRLRSEGNDNSIAAFEEHGVMFEVGKYGTRLSLDGEAI